MYGQLQSFKFREGPKPASATSFSQYSRGKYSSGWEMEGEKWVSWRGQPRCSQGFAGWDLCTWNMAVKSTLLSL